MVTRQRILELIPHQGAMCLLESALAWSTTDITCVARSHLSPDNPLRRDDRLYSVCGIEYGLQAAALHGGLLDGTKQPAGYLAALRDVNIRIGRLDDPSIGALRVMATQEICRPQGLIYRFALAAEDGTELLSGRATLAGLAAVADVT
jgi:predicted hotdog family 3-hydroxylacyl-ACP dehydratase